MAVRLKHSILVTNEQGSCCNNASASDVLADVECVPRWDACVVHLAELAGPGWTRPGGGRDLDRCRLTAHAL